MNQPIISVENLGKRYRIHHKQPERYAALRDVIAQKLKGIFNRSTSEPQSSTSEEDFWALKDVSFNVQPGEVVGIIGRNGAGKSTLLKILSRITEQTEGRVTLRGRVASLLEVGTGFHPELTGRENIFLNGAILGMTRAEIRKRFDEIVAFAEVEKFLDTPVKHYSSGMYVRLAFAVAAHLDPEILIVDEVLAVGDAEFQKKCTSKLDDVAKSGRAILFVSHQMEAIRRLCSRLIWLKDGGVHADSGDAEALIRQYVSSSTGSDNSIVEWRPGPRMKSDPCFTLLRVALMDGEKLLPPHPVPNNQPVTVAIEATTNDPKGLALVGLTVSQEDGTVVFQTFHTDSDVSDWPQIPAGRFRLSLHLPTRFLNEGKYTVEICCGARTHWIYEPGTGGPEVLLEIKGGLSDSPYWLKRRPGLVAPVLTWKVAQLSH